MEMDYIICHVKDRTDLIYGVGGTTDFDAVIDVYITCQK